MSKYTAALTPHKYLSRTEQAALLAILDGHQSTSLRNTTMFMLMLKVGTRSAETMNLTWHDINFIDKSIYVQSSKGSNDRVLPLTKNLVYRLKLLKAQTSGKDEDRLFNFSLRHLRRIWYEYRPVKKKIHSLRHTFAFNFYHNSRYNLFLTQTALGHKNLQSTAIYLQIHCDLDDFRKAIGD